MVGGHKNQKEAIALDEQIQKLNPALRLSRYSTYEGVIKKAGLVVTEKGNSKLIADLTALGFEKVGRRKIVDNPRIQSYAGYRYVVELEIPLEGKLDE